MNTEHTDSAPANNGRDERGRFAAGNRGGPGNPFARQVAGLRQALLDSVTPKDMQEVAGKLIALAKEGDVQAAKLLLSYVIGKPQPAPEPDRLDTDEWQIYQETTPMKKESAAVMQAGTPEFHLNCVRAMRPVLTELMQEQIGAIVNETPEQRARREADESDGMFDVPDERAYPPSSNGVNGQPPPSANGKKPQSPERNGQYHPSTNGDLPPDSRSKLPV